MFHVSTLLPYYPRDEQQVERKRHLGNDIVVIVFLEPGAQFTPRLMTTQFNRTATSTSLFAHRTRAHQMSNEVWTDLWSCPPDIYCVVQMEDADSDVPAVRVEYAAKVPSPAPHSRLVLRPDSLLFVCQRW
jgi:hypothetical protein